MNQALFPATDTAGAAFAHLGLNLGVRLPPASMEAEQALLGAMLANNKAVERAQRAGIQEKHFADAVHGRIYAKIAALVAQGRLADAVTLRATCDSDGTLHEVGGSAYLTQLLTAMVGIVNAGEYARLIRDLWVRRELIELGERVVNDAFAAEAEVSGPELVESVAQRLHALQLDGGAEQGRLAFLSSAVEEAIAAAEAAFASPGGVSGMSTGFPALDEALGGMEEGGVYVLAARPGMGKTALAVQVILRAAYRRLASIRRNAQDPSVPIERGRCAFISLEMERKQVGQRALSLASGVDFASIRRGFFLAPNRQRHADAIVAARGRMAELPLLIEDQPQITVEAIERQAREASRRLGGLDLLVVDHLHIVGKPKGRRSDGETADLTAIVHDIKALAKRLHVPVLLLAQLNRGVEGRDDKRPMLSDLRQAGAIEEDAEAVLMLYRPEYYIGDTPPERKEGESPAKHAERCTDWQDRRDRVRGLAEVLIPKNRGGEANVTVRLGWDATRVRFVDNPDLVSSSTPELQD